MANRNVEKNRGGTKAFPLEFIIEMEFPTLLSSNSIHTRENGNAFNLHTCVAMCCAVLCRVIAEMSVKMKEHPTKQQRKKKNRKYFSKKTHKILFDGWLILVSCQMNAMLYRDWLIDTLDFNATLIPISRDLLVIYISPVYYVRACVFLFISHSLFWMHKCS